MSLVHLANVCSHLQNCTRVRLSLTSIPYTKLHLQVAYNLYKHGFVSSLQRGSTKGPDVVSVEVTPDNISTRRLWVGLKYRENKPVLSQFGLISKPNLKIILDHSDLTKLCSGISIRKIKPLQPGELILVKDMKNNVVLDINEAIAKRKDNVMVLCRAK
ncbi:probable 37S ribosomal protein S8, mitochondrial [Saccharomycodes ludwigii]|uniref:Probable 37S ribosomal protein S8, mitochondrial n=1 Tax=Saccharomycodes ludwigii TaxID=36035 RepID=A0A376B570_9ASCO|nr:hypothetical protein SCDLUD_002663 [Saccharomycodes ludwigii]KAH3901179.1 hypothetical protein SCDLUD_002663 [Saccharomycodes ludwigii]SSD59836.1 probable 37S ribosomal protein S8, mitochondrial [Saccharomycodes ludwigii]